MALQIFAYVNHKEGNLDDSALELPLAAQKIDPEAAVTALLTGSGDKLDAACQAARNLSAGTPGNRLSRIWENRALLTVGS